MINYKENKIDLLIHIGMGKTGSTSIQKSLGLNNKLLKNRGVKFVGIYLNNVILNKYDWQKTDNVQAFFSKNKQKINNEIYEVLNKEIDYSLANNINTLIWSNESLFQAFDIISEALNKLKNDKRVNLKIIIYFREHISWVQSAYKQWGLKHKNYSGKIKKFDDWDFWMNPPKYFNTLKPILNQFKKEVIIRNMSSKKDVVEDFFKICNIDMEQIKLYRDNDSPSNEELFFRTLFNDKFKEPTHPKTFDMVVKKDKINFECSINQYMRELLPNESKLKEIDESIQTDKEEMNKTFRLFNEEGFSEIKKFKDINLDLEKIVFSLAQLVIKNTVQINNMENTKNMKKKDLLDANQIDLIRDVALIIEDKDLKKAFELMSIAQQLRPTGSFIKNKIEEYKRKLNNDNR